MFTVFTASEIRIETTKFNTISEACAYAYANKNIFVNISYNDIILYNRIRDENKNIIFEKIWARELLT